MALDELDEQLLPGGTLLVVVTLGRGTARARAGASSSSVEIMAEECWRGEARAATAVVSDRARDQCSVLSAQWSPCANVAWVAVASVRTTSHQPRDSRIPHHWPDTVILGPAA